MSDIVTIGIERCIVLADRLYDEAREMYREKIYDDESDYTSHRSEDHEPLMEILDLLHITSEKECIGSEILSIDEILVSLSIEYTLFTTRYAIELIDVRVLHLEKVIL
jgi:hypothetical protein